MAKSKIELLLDMRDRMSGAIRKARNAVTGGTRQMAESFREARSRIGHSTDGMKKKIGDFRSSAIKNFQQVKEAIPGISRVVELLKNPLLIVTAVVGGLVMGFRRIVSAAKGWVDANNAQQVAETKLAAVMRQNTGATDAQIDSVKQLASEQQKLGVIGDEVQIAGAQELATYGLKAKSINKLLPAINDMVAQQYGLNASQEQYTQIATMVGKVMDGQTGALSRYGYSFTKAQKKILETGKESQRTAVLYDIINEAVGGVNAALAATPEGKFKQIENEMGDLKEQAGGVFLDLKTAMIPFYEFLQRGLTRIIAWVKNNADEIKAVISSVMNFVQSVIRSVFSFLKFIYPFREAIMGLVAGFLAWKIATMAQTVATWLLNVAMAANPIGIVVMAIVALIGIIMVLRNRYQGWGTLFKAIGVTIVNYLKQLVANWKFAFQEIWFAVQLVWLRIQSFAQYVGQLFANIGKAMKEVLKGNFSEARDILKQKITTDAEVKIKEVEKQRSDNREKFKNESIERGKEVVNAWKAVSITEKVKEKTDPEGKKESILPTGGGSGDDDTRNDNNKNSDSLNADKVAGSAAQVRNITINVKTLGAEHFNVNNPALQNKPPQDAEDFFTDLLTRALRNIEMSY